MPQTTYRCPKCHGALSMERNGLRGEQGHFFPFARDGAVPVFSRQPEGSNEYTVEQAAEIHDNSLRWLFDTFGIEESELRRNLHDRLRLKHGQKVLITGVGAGNDLPSIAERIGKEGVIYAQDFSAEMLLAAFDRAATLYGLAGQQIEFSVSDATNLPFRDAVFDAVYHFGGINLYSDIAAGISEMDRVVKHGGRVVFGDEGLAPWLKDTENGRMIINNNPILDFDAPLDLIPKNARDVNLSWDASYNFYIIDYTASKEPLTFNPDVPHVGRRGGTMRTRYYGRLEGVDPALKDALYAKAERLGVSRVDFIETLLRDGLSDRARS